MSAPADFEAVWLQFKSDDIPAIQQHLESKGVAFDGPHTRPWGGTYLFFRDPNGARVAVFAGCN
jgi:predicted enzyme related to lactoylglutathione lyase